MTEEQIAIKFREIDTVVSFRLDRLDEAVSRLGKELREIREMIESKNYKCESLSQQH